MTRQPAELVTAFVTVFGAKSAQAGQLRKVRFLCFFVSDGKEPLVSLVFGRKQAPDAHFALDSVFSPEKQANSIPPSLSPFVTALSPLSFGPKSAQKRPSSRVPEDFVLRKFESILKRVDSLMSNVGSLMLGRRWECRDSALTTETRELLALEPSFRTWKSEAGSAASGFAASV